VPDEGPVVTNSGPLIGLAAAGKLDLLGALFDSVLVPAAVYQEVVGAGLGRPGTDELPRAPWATVIHVDPPPEPLLAEELGPGEAEAITLARNRKARLLLLDDRRARRIAEVAYGLRVKGAAGILLEAKRRGLVAAVRPLVEAMQAQGYRLSERLVRGVLQETGE